MNILTKKFFFYFKTSKIKLFLTCNIVGLAVAFLISLIFGEKFKTVVNINYPTHNDFLFQNQIKNFLQLDSNFSLHFPYKIVFNKNFMSDENLQDFINNDKKNSLALQKFGNNIKLIKKFPRLPDDREFFLVFNKGVDGKTLLINYIEYIKTKSLEEFFNEYRRLILINIESKKKFYQKIAKEKYSDSYIQFQNVNQLMRIEQDIEELNLIYSQFEFKNFRYRPYDDLPSDPSHLYYSNYSIIFFGLIFGSLLFFLIIFLTSNFVNKKKFFLKNNL